MGLVRLEYELKGKEGWCLWFVFLGQQQDRRKIEVCFQSRCGWESGFVPEIQEFIEESVVEI